MGIILTQTATTDLQITDEWLDREVDSQYKDQPLAQHWARVSKIGEELGEAIQSLIGATGQNPRKGIINDIDDVLDELADVVFTGLCAIQHFTKDTEQTDYILATRLERISGRAKK